MTLCSNQYALAIGVNDIDAHFCVCSSLVLSPGLFVILFLKSQRPNPQAWLQAESAGL